MRFAVLLVALVGACTSPAAVPAPLEFTLPQTGATLTGPVTLSVAGGDLATVTFSLDGNVIDVVENAPWEWTLDPGTLTAGTHVVTVSAQRASGGVESTTIDVVIEEPPEPEPEPEPPPPDPDPPPGDQVSKWKRFELALDNTTWSGNAFDLELTATFTHTDTGRSLTQLGFYAGQNVWKVYFMPDRLGAWTYTTASPDSDLNGKAGAFNCVASSLPGALEPVDNRWKLSDTGKHVAPIILTVSTWFKTTDTADGIDDLIKWAKDTAGARVIGTTLVSFRQDQKQVAYVKGQEGAAFNIPFWDRLNSHFDAIRDAGMGHYILIYTDDSDRPSVNGVDAKSAAEQRLFRYLVARFSAYPIVMWDSGVDIGEYRDEDWIDWYADWFLQNDPWKHPVGSRSGGGSGGKHPTNGTYWSDGARIMPVHADFVNTWKGRSVPTAFTDRWREDFRRGGFDEDDIRRAVWEVGLVGGSACIVAGDDPEGLRTDYATDFGAAAACGYRSEFFRERIKDLSKLAPHDELVSAGTAVLSADPGKEYVAYMVIGGSVTIDLKHASGKLAAQFYNPRAGTWENPSEVDGGGEQVFAAPDANDWVLHITKK